MTLLALENAMTEETGQGIHEELCDLRQQFDAFRNWIIGGALAMTVSLIGQAAIVAWKASDVSTRVTHNETRLIEQESLTDRLKEEQVRRATTIESIQDMHRNMQLLRDLMQDVRQDVLLLKSKGM